MYKTDAVWWLSTAIVNTVSQWSGYDCIIMKKQRNKTGTVESLQKQFAMCSARFVPVAVYLHKGCIKLILTYEKMKKNEKWKKEEIKQEWKKKQITLRFVLVF